MLDSDETLNNPLAGLGRDCFADTRICHYFWENETTAATCDMSSQQF